MDNLATRPGASRDGIASPGEIVRQGMKAGALDLVALRAMAPLLDWIPPPEFTFGPAAG